MGLNDGYRIPHHRSSLPEGGPDGGRRSRASGAPSPARWAALFPLLLILLQALPGSAAGPSAPNLRPEGPSDPANLPVETPVPPDEQDLPEAIGTSLGGRPLEVHRFGQGPEARLIVAGIHGGYEWNTIALARRLIEHLRENPDLVPPDITLYILPSLNPDGEARSSGYAGRANDAGVDLNRNFPVRWAPDWPRSGCWDFLPIHAGPYPTSEPETQAFMRFVLDREIQALISYHSAALGIFAGAEPGDVRSPSLAAAIDLVSDYPYPPIDTGCLYTGQLVDWASASGIAAVDVELSTHWGTDFRQNLEILRVFLNWRP